MSRFRHLIALVLLAIWVPATMHCGLEGLVEGSAEMCDHHDAADNGTPAGEHLAVEDGSYRANSFEVAITAPLPLDGWVVADAIRVIAPVDPVDARHADDAPADLARTWQFGERAALPANAPSVVS
jgi:hypothetical protein